MTSFVFGNFYFDYYTNGSGLGFRLGFGLELELGLRLKLVFLGFISKCLRKWNICQVSSYAKMLFAKFSHSYLHEISLSELHKKVLEKIF